MENPNMQLKRFLTLFLFAAFVTGAWAQVPRSKHVVVVTLENHSYEQAVGNSQMPYFNALISKYAIADQYYATMHNSLSTLMWLTAGQTVTLNDNTMQFFNVDNIVRHMQQDGRSWKVYASQLPYTGYLGYNVNEYVKRHNPIAYFTDVESSLKYNIGPSSPYFQRDIANGTLPEYSYVTPDLIEDAHKGTLAQADAWLKANIPQLLASPQFQKDGILFIVWDEGNVQPIDPRNGGGRVATLVIGPGVKRGYHSQVQYNHQSLLRSTCIALALSGCPGGGAEGVPMTDFFVPTKSSTLQVRLISPSHNAVDGAVELQAAGMSGASPVTGMAAYVSGALMAKSATANLNGKLNLAPGTYTLTVRAWDASGQHTDLQRTITVTAPTLAVNLIFPTTTLVAGGALHIQATGISGVNPAAGMAAYVGSKQVAQSAVPSISTDVSLPAGNYTVTVRVWDTAGASASKQYSVAVQ
jgi:acid phosphatase